VLFLQAFLLQSPRPRGHQHKMYAVILLEELKPVISMKNNKD